ncbi:MULTISPECIES: Panacea domain-containing protein [Enterococcus]|uniref:Panacea domain-containing protein n=1 Tax=Enterococcus TaxID=1350 RepID=UPI000CF2B20E|nr:type II toxin-antitoxin system antitoxin SocA domain-containing protein [Enterococcus faecium]EGP5554423.1 DUF4065 domain-containing protein [Enterococcus faecium]EGP5700155.1 DUF4065 domain-containing protein [Enterococcus faecium]EME3492368.1 SocA family protein [Enterococcus faecium]MBK0899154.1 SocA family protein [Enterococcus faecium]MCU1822869.1 DUF4065 domain-containing protein [Enterococcus faecium]
MHKPKDVAKWFVANTDVASGSQITPLKIQKLLYYAQAWYLAIYNKPLMDTEFEAWAHGPVVPEVYHGLSDFKYNPVSISAEYFSDAEEVSCEQEVDLLQQIMDIYGIYDGKYLEKLTHQEDPWIQTRGDLPPEARCNEVISREVMKDFYRNMQGE